jgi:hypothetical protein
MYDYISLGNATATTRRWWSCCSNTDDELFEKQVRDVMTKLKESNLQKNVEINKYNNIISEHIQNGKKYLNEDQDEERATSEARLLEEAIAYRTCLIAKKEKTLILKREIEKCLETANTSLTFESTSDALRDILKKSLNVTTVDEIQVKIDMSLKEVDDISKSLVKTKKKPLKEMFDFPTLENVNIETINNNNQDVLINK